MRETFLLSHDKTRSRDHYTEAVPVHAEINASAISKRRKGERHKVGSEYMSLCQRNASPSSKQINNERLPNWVMTSEYFHNIVFLISARGEVEEVMKENTREINNEARI